jgi:hypothetical protein
MNRPGIRGRYKTTADDAHRMVRAILTTAVADGLIAKKCSSNSEGAPRHICRACA